MYSRNEKDQILNFSREQEMHKIRANGNSRTKTFNNEIKNPMDHFHTY